MGNKWNDILTMLHKLIQPESCFQGQLYCMFRGRIETPYHLWHSNDSVLSAKECGIPHFLITQ